MSTSNSAAAASTGHKPSRYTFRRYMWTWFPPEEEQGNLRYLVFDLQSRNPDHGEIEVSCWLDSKINHQDPKHRFSIYQLEACPTTQRLHYQGYSEFTTPVTITAIKKMFDLPGCHYEPANSEQKACVKYCSKKDTRVFGPWYHGTPGIHQGSRTDLHALLELACQEASPKAALKALGPIAMRNLPLYIRTVRVIQDDDAEANKINRLRRERRAERAVRAGLPIPPDTESSSDEDDITYA